MGVIDGATVSRGIKRPLEVAFPVRLKKARLRAWVSALALSTSANLGSTSVGLLEAGKRLPRLRTIAQLASALNVPGGWLAFGDPKAPLGTSDTDGLGKRLRELREAQGLTLHTLGRLTGTSYAQAKSLEKGSDPTIEIVELYAAVLKVRSTWLAFGLGDRALPRRGRPALEKAAESPG